MSKIVINTKPLTANQKAVVETLHAHILEFVGSFDAYLEGEKLAMPFLRFYGELFAPFTVKVRWSAPKGDKIKTFTTKLRISCKGRDWREREASIEASF